MGVSRTAEDLELLQHGNGQAVLRQHALDRVHDDEFRMTLTHRRDLAVALATHESGKEHILVLLLFPTRQRDLIGIDDHNVIPCVNVRSVNGLVPAADQIGDLDGETTERNTSGINKMPFGLHCLLLCEERFHAEKRPTGRVSQNTVNRVFRVLLENLHALFEQKPLDLFPTVNVRGWPP